MTSTSPHATASNTNPISPTPRATSAPFPPPTRIAIYVIAVSGLGWLGPLIDHAVGHGLGALLDEDVLTRSEPTPWIFSPGIDGLVVIATTALTAALFMERPNPTRSPDHKEATS